jgi:hypothetical protein
MPPKRLPIEELKQIWDYDPDTGVFTWKIRPVRNSRVQIGDVAGRVTNTGSGEHRYIGYKKHSYNASQLAWAFSYDVWPTRRLCFKDENSLNVAINNLQLSIGVGEHRFPTKTPEGRAAYSKAHRKMNKDYYRNSDLKRSFGITLEQYNEILSEQNGVCSICSQPERSMRRGSLKLLAVDHCHSTGKIRELLCSKCNPMLGYAGDSPELLEKAAAYLRKHQRLAEAPLPNNVVKLKEAR